MKKSFLTKILTIALSAGLIFHPVIVYADEPVIRLWRFMAITFSSLIQIKIHLFLRLSYLQQGLPGTNSYILRILPWL